MNCFFRDQHEALFKATKPYQYVGGEFLSRNKDFDSASVRFAFVFPDNWFINCIILQITEAHKKCFEEK